MPHLNSIEKVFLAVSLPVPSTFLKEKRRYHTHDPNLSHLTHFHVKLGNITCLTQCQSWNQKPNGLASPSSFHLPGEIQRINKSENRSIHEPLKLRKRKCQIQNVRKSVLSQPQALKWKLQKTDRREKTRS